MNKRLIQMIVLIASISGIARAYDGSVDFDQMATYADNAIMDAAATGHRSVKLHFGDAKLSLIEKLADDLRSRGYILDEETALLNPRIIKVLRLAQPYLSSPKGGR